MYIKQTESVNKFMKINVKLLKIKKTFKNCCNCKCNLEDYTSFAYLNLSEYTKTITLLMPWKYVLSNYGLVQLTIFWVSSTKLDNFIKNERIQLLIQKDHRLNSNPVRFPIVVFYGIIFWQFPREIEFLAPCCLHPK